MKYSYKYIKKSLVLFLGVILRRVLMSECFFCVKYEHKCILKECKAVDLHCFAT